MQGRAGTYKPAERPRKRHRHVMSNRDYRFKTSNSNCVRAFHVFGRHRLLRELEGHGPTEHGTAHDARHRRQDRTRDAPQTARTFAPFQMAWAAYQHYGDPMRTLDDYRSLVRLPVRRLDRVPAPR